MSSDGFCHVLFWLCAGGNVSYLSALRSSVPFINFFDGFRTSHEYQKVELMDQEDIRPLLDMNDVKRFRDRAMSPERPVTRGTAENPETFFTHREASNKYYNSVPEIVEHFLGEISKITGREHHLFDYYGAEDAENIIILMGSATEAAKEAIDYLLKQGKKVGMVAVHLFRPFSKKHLLQLFLRLLSAFRCSTVLKSRVQRANLYT